MEGDAPACLILTDEPYDVKIAGHVTGGGLATASGEMTEVEFVAFNEDWMTTVLSHLRDGGIIGTFIDWRRPPIVTRPSKLIEPVVDGGTGGRAG
jgi:hypothetical protein